MTLRFEDSLKEKVQFAEQVVYCYLPKEEDLQKMVLEAMNYSVAAGGKRLRPVFMKEAFHLFGGKSTLVEPFMAAMEMIHTYSLVHDDLPAMDNDEYRRGRKTTHIVYGEAFAILAGDGLLNYAFETAAGAFNVTDKPEKVGRAIQILGNKSGIYGMLGGQCADIIAEGKEITEDNLRFIHLNKTAALLEAAMSIGAVLAGASDNEVDIVLSVARDVGLAFQIQDDILDVTSTTEELGKPVGSDEKNQKITYVTMVGLEKAQREVERLSKKAQNNLELLEKESSFLSELIGSLINRRK